MSVLPADLDTRRRQRNASDPSVSAWVSANAGAGKTTVLRNRVLRLLLGGAEPGRVLCLTFTKAAAAEMSNRVFAELSRWVGLDDEALARAIADIAGEPPSVDALAQARRLFARAVETPGGLRVDTIHGFCTRLLQAFAFEANVPARFTVLEEPQAEELMAQARRFVLADALAGRDAGLAAALSRLSEQVSVRDFGDVVQAALGLRLRRPDDAEGQGFVARLREDLSQALGIGAGLARADIEREIWSPGQAALVKRAAAAWRHGSTKDQARAEAAAKLAGASPAERLAAYVELLLTRDAQSHGLRPQASLSTAGARKADPDVDALLQAEAERLARLLDRMNALETCERSLALFAIAAAIRARFAKLKAERGGLDFDDLIAATRRLLDRASAAFVLYKLDATIEHLLVDEAQDTNSEYWAILRSLTAEFTAGRGARGPRLRTVFAVGDEKQSIYGFQGAEPKVFGVMRERFGEDYAPLAEEAGRELYRKETLNVSFRSTRDVLAAVDAVFAVKEHYEGLTSDGEQPPPHESTRLGEPGAVDLWPVLMGDESADVDPFGLPELGAMPASAEVKLARRIAAEIKRLMAEGCDLGRSVHPGDLLILVRRRGKMFEAVIRALKRAGVPVAGADRLSLSTHIAVEDLVAAGRAALLPEDDLTVAELLKSPLIGLTDEDLLRFAPERKVSLRQALRDGAAAVPPVDDPTRSQSDDRLAAADERLLAMREAALGQGVFGFYARLLGPEGGRKALAARLGAEAAEASDEVLRLALAHERGGKASLSAFLDALETSGADIKRDLSAERGEVRVMTVHGAKGLEAPIVILADACAANERAERFLSIALPEGGEVPVWVPRKELDCAETAAGRLTAAANLAREDRRLLYVAMTRARDRLIVAGCPVRGKIPKASWYAMVSHGLTAATSAGLVDLPARPGEEPVKRWRVSTIAGPARSPAAAVAALPEAAPDWLFRQAAPEPVATPPLRPSSALDAADAASSGASSAPLADREALLAGRFAHALLEYLPPLSPESRAGAAQALAGELGGGLSLARRDAIIAEVQELISRSPAAPLFSDASLAEVSVTGEIESADGRFHAVSGRIDRLVVTAEAVLIADFKTSLPARGRALWRILVQLAIYRSLARALYPGRAIRSFLIGLDGPRWLEPADAELDAALELLDVGVVDRAAAGS